MCKKAASEEYSSLKEATFSCNNNFKCGMITDFQCASNKWTICMAKDIRKDTSGEGTCAWLKRYHSKL